MLTFAEGLFAQDSADEDSAEESTPKAGLLDFGRDIQPIFAEKCLSCHSGDDAKNGFEINDAEAVLAYIEPGDVQSSSLWTDYLVTDDADMLMPPPGGDAAPLTGVELATIKLWIEEGSQWGEVDTVASPSETAEVIPASMAARVWLFQGLFHPATVHFPIALLTVSAGFVLLSFVWRDTCEPVAFHCLWIGALGAAIASAAGWAYAVSRGYGQSFSFDLAESAIDRHRWLGIAAAILALLLIPMAVYVRRTGNGGMRLIWLLSSLFLVGAVSMAGYQGGELVFGEGHYEKEFERLFPSDILPVVEVEVETASQDSETTSAASAEQ